MTEPAGFEDLIQYMRRIGAAEVEHSDGSYLAHAAGVYRDLKAWGCSDEICDAGLFHSIYGTELFQRFTLPLEKREGVRALIGERAERLVYLNCAIVYASFDATVARDERPYTMIDRFTGDQVEITSDDFEDLCTIHLCDRLEQFPRSRDVGFRTEVFRHLAKRLGGVALEAYERVMGPLAEIPAAVRVD